MREKSWQLKERGLNFPTVDGRDYEYGHVCCIGRLCTKTVLMRVKVYCKQESALSM